MIFTHSNSDIKEDPLGAPILAMFIASILLVIAFFKAPSLVEVPE